MVDAGRARRLSKRIATIVASAIEFEIKDPPLAFVTVTDTKVGRGARARQDVAGRT